MQIQVTNDVEDFIVALEKTTIARVLRTIDLLESVGHQLGMPHSKKIDRKLFELRVRGRQEVRIFYTFKRKKAILRSLAWFCEKIPENTSKGNEVGAEENGVDMI